MIRLWRGYHSEDLPSILRKSWLNDDLLILCPPNLESSWFIAKLPDGELETVGTWSPAQLTALSAAPRTRSSAPYPARPVLGVFTTGTAGRPKLILYSKKNVENSLHGIRSFFDLTRIKSIYCYPQPFHTFGLTLGYLQAMLYDCRLIAPPGRYAESSHSLRASITDGDLLTLGTPTHFHDLIESRLSLSPSYSCIIGGAPVRSALWRDVRERLGIREPSIGYGATEASPGITHLPPGRAPKEDGEIGFPLPGLTLSIQPESGVEFSGDNVCLAVIQTAGITFPSRLLIPDEIKRRETDGVLVYRGRLDLVLNRGGRKFSCEAIEDALHREFGIRGIAVAIPDLRLGEDLGLLIAADHECTTDANLLRRAQELLRDRFHCEFNPAYFHLIPEFPTNANAKPDRPACAAWLREKLGMQA